MPWSALPDHLNSPEEAANNFQDDQQMGLWGQFRARYKGWFAFGPRCPEWWAKWREFPILLASYFSGPCRQENTDGTLVETMGSGFMTDLRSETWKWRNFVGDGTNRFYVARVQYFAAWHVQLQWPLFLGFHFGQWQGYIGFKRDADKVYWLALYFGKVWK